MRIILSYGGNIPPLKERFFKTLSLIKREINIVAGGNLYLTEPVGPSKRYFLNSMLVIETKKDPAQVFERISALERALGRSRSKRWGDRTVDLDVVIAEEECFLPSLKIPHPQFSRRRFWLIPIVEDRLMEHGRFRFRRAPLTREILVQMIKEAPPLNLMRLT